MSHPSSSRTVGGSPQGTPATVAAVVAVAVVVVEAEEGVGAEEVMEQPEGLNGHLGCPLPIKVEVSKEEAAAVAPPTPTLSNSMQTGTCATAACWILRMDTPARLAPPTCASPTIRCGVHPHKL